MRLKNCHAGIRTSFLRSDAERGRPLELLFNISSKCFFSSNFLSSVFLNLWLKILSARRRPSRDGLTGDRGDFDGSIDTGVEDIGDSGLDNSTLSTWIVSFFSRSRSSVFWVADLTELIVFCLCRNRLTSMRLLKYVSKQSSSVMTPSRSCSGMATSNNRSLTNL